MVWITMNRLKLLPVVGCGIVALTVGCAAVYTNKPIGEKPPVISSEDWEGVWVGNGFAIHIDVVDEENREVQAVWIGEWKGVGVELQYIPVYLTQWGGWLFCSVTDAKGSQQYMWGRLKRQGGQILIWWADAERVRPLVEEGVLPGTVENGDVILGNLTAEHMELITSDAKGVLFNWEQPLVLFRIGN